MSARSIHAHMRVLRSVPVAKRPARALPFTVIFAAVLLAVLLGRL